jgi:hypothetical protein
MEGKGTESYRKKVAREMGKLQDKFQKECDKALSRALAKSIRVGFGMNQTRGKVASQTDTLVVSYIILNKKENPTGPGMYSRSCKFPKDLPLRVLMVIAIEETVLSPPIRRCWSKRVRASTASNTRK